MLEQIPIAFKTSSIGKEQQVCIEASDTIDSKKQDVHYIFPDAIKVHDYPIKKGFRNSAMWIANPHTMKSKPIDDICEVFECEHLVNVLDTVHSGIRYIRHVQINFNSLCL